MAHEFSFHHFYDHSMKIVIFVTYEMFLLFLFPVFFMDKA